MRTPAVLAAIAMLTAGSFASAAGSAQTRPSAEQIVKSLTPTSVSGATRGLRVGPTAAAQTQRSPPAPAINLSVQFATGSADLTAQAIHVLDNLGKALNDQTLAGYRFRIEGHTDTVGTREYNKDLSTGAPPPWSSISPIVSTSIAAASRRSGWARTNRLISPIRPPNHATAVRKWSSSATEYDGKSSHDLHCPHVIALPVAVIGMPPPSPARRSTTAVPKRW
jgi:hypothetical protein